MHTEYKHCALSNCATGGTCIYYIFRGGKCHTKNVFNASITSQNLGVLLKHVHKLVHLINFSVWAIFSRTKVWLILGLSITGVLCPKRHTPVKVLELHGKQKQCSNDLHSEAARISAFGETGRFETILTTVNV